MKCVIPGCGIKGEQASNEMMLSTPKYTLSLCYTAFGKAIFCLSKIGEELYIEAQDDGVSLTQ